MQHQSAENIFETNTNLGGKEHPPRFHARDTQLAWIGAKFERQQLHTRPLFASDSTSPKPKTVIRDFIQFSHN